MAVTENSKEYNALLVSKTNIGGWFFDAYTNINHQSDLTITSNPVETGASVSDHAYMQPLKLTVEIVMSDTATSVVYRQFGGSWSRSRKAYDVLNELQSQRIPLTVLTRLRKYDNMLILSMGASDNNTTLNGLRCTVTLQQLIVARVKTVKVSAYKQVTDSTQSGTVQTTTTPESILSQLFGGS